VDEILTRSISLNCGLAHAFTVFTDKIDLWWPREHRRHRDGTMHIAGDALLDRAPDGSEWRMATIVRMEPPSLLRLDWYPGSPGAPTAVEVRFSGNDSHTEIVVTHRPLPETRPIWPQRVPTFERGWSTVLPALKSYIEEE
jgi:uncharacterized protein YndB with AHSA1/START domain